ncbi:MAG: hypothetical protein IKH04_12550 [Kiritimatiellae bacterium]|nr:hypothetical protein [Kiritimatiellia bacterium]
MSKHKIKELTSRDVLRLTAGASFPLFALFALTVVCGTGYAASGGRATGPATPLPPIRVEGPRIVAGGEEVRLRGVNWGWWHDAGTAYTEREAERMAQWGANLVRLPFSYKDVESPSATASPGISRPRRGNRDAPSAPMGQPYGPQEIWSLPILRPYDLQPYVL